MVWSDQSQFPFYVIDNNGNIIVTIDQTGIHMVGSAGRIDLQIDGVGQPTIFFSDVAQTVQSFINAPILAGFATIAIDSSTWVSALPGNPILRSLLWLKNNLVQLGVVGPALARIGGQFDTTDIQARLFYNDETGTQQGTVLVNKNGVFLGKTTDPNQLQYLNSTGYLQLSATVNPAAAWTNLVLKNGWTALAGYGPAQARINPFGAVELRGTLRNGVVTDNTNIFDMPWAAMTPASNKLLRPPVGPSGAGNVGSSRLFNNTSASFFCYGMTGVTDVGLDGLYYYV